MSSTPPLHRRSAPLVGAERWRWPRELTALPVAALLVPAALVLLGLGSYGLLNNNEGMYAEIAREMAEGGSWIIPHLNGVPYIEKPPLVYWLMAIAMRVAGDQEHVVRAVPALAGALTLAAVWLFTSRVATRTCAWLAVLVLGSMLGFVAMSRLVMLDMWLTAGLSLALFGGYGVVHGSDRRIQILTGAALAVAVLAKGWIAVLLFGLVLACYVASLGRKAAMPAVRRLATAPLWVTFLVLALPWHLAATLELPEFAWFYFINEHVLRFLGLREPHDYYGGPLWYYVPRLLLGLLPWTLLLFVRRRSASAGPLGGDARRFLWMASLVPLALISISSAKANYYAVMCLPPLAILIAGNVSQLAFEGRATGFSVRVAAAALLLAAAVYVGDSRSALDAAALHTSAPAAGVIAATVLFCIFAAHLARLQHWSAAWLFVAALGGPALWFAIGQVQEHEGALSARELLAEHEEVAGGTTWIYADFENFSSLPFYAEGPVQVIDSRSNDLAFAQQHGFGQDLFVSSGSVAPDARGLVWFERRRASELGATALGPRLRHLGCSGNQCVAALTSDRP
ncbi:MAG: glycosyltransferase family 39 protein [Pseudomonadota bacterium]|nr:glycosyltransferase family 39 protein [Pseudomonadota bacterium]